MVQFEIRFEYIDESKLEPTITNIGDIFKSFFTLLTFYLREQNVNIGRNALLVQHIRDPPLTVSFSLNVDIDDMTSALNWMRDYWHIIQDENMSLALQLTGINLTAINNSLNTQISIDQLVKWEDIVQDEELLDQLSQFDPKIEKRIKLIQHIKRAKYWRF